MAAMLRCIQPPLLHRSSLGQPDDRVSTTYGAGTELDLTIILQSSVKTVTTLNVDKN
jgi:hypothetical protein